MAADNNTIQPLSPNTIKNNRNFMNKLRDCGLEYVSTSGKLIPAKSQPNIFCHCPQRCQKKLAKEKWKELFEQFYELADQNKQNLFLKAHIHIKRLHLNNLENRPGDKQTAQGKRRVSCKYHVPDLQTGETLDLYLEKMSCNSFEVCQKAFMNVFGITEKRVRMQRERSIAAMAPEYYQKPEKTAKSVPDLLPINLSKESPPRTEEKPKMKRTHEEMQKSDEPLDLSNHSEKDLNPLSVEIDPTKLYELAAMLGIPKNSVDRKMLEKYEGLVRMNLAKHNQKNPKRKVDVDTKMEHGPIVVHPMSNQSEKSQGLKGISKQVVGLEDNLAILPMQTLNNGDLTITPVMTTQTSVENYDIMQVNSFFQNQLWRPEYIGLQSCKNDLS